MGRKPGESRSSELRELRHDRPLTQRQQYCFDLHERYPEKSYAELHQIAHEEGYAFGLSQLTRHIAAAKAKKGVSKDNLLAHPPPQQIRRNRILAEVKKEVLEQHFSNVALNFVSSLSNMADADIDSLTAKERVLVAAIATDKRLVLRGEPNQIVDVRDNRRAMEVAAAMVQELKRRGMEIDVTPDHQERPPTFTPRAIEEMADG